MADLPDIKKQVQGSSAQMPPPPAPGPDDDLPAPAPPQGQANDIPDAPTPVEGGKEEAEQKPQPAKQPEQKPAPAPAPQPKKEEPPKKQEGGMQELRPAMPKPASREAVQAAEEAADVSTSPPVFIKIDKYAEMVRNIRKLKSYAMNLRDALDALADIEKELNTGIAISHKALDDFNNAISMLDARLSHTNSVNQVESDDTQEIDNYIKGIYDQMERIKGELSNIQ